MACNHDCGFFRPDVSGELVDLVRKMSQDLTEVKTRVHIYLGNGTPGQVPVALDELKVKVSKHETFINRTQGAMKFAGSGLLLAIVGWILKAMKVI